MKIPLFRVQLLAVLFCFLFVSASFINCRSKASAPVRRKSSNGAASLESLYLLWETAQNILVDLLGPKADEIFDELRRHFNAIEKTADMLESLQDSNVINSLNEVSGIFFTGLEDAVKANNDALTKESLVSAETFNKLMMAYQNKIMSVLRSSKGLPESLKTPLTETVPALSSSLIMIYSNVVKSTGMQIPSFIFTLYMPDLLKFRHLAIVSTKTFEHVSNIRGEVMKAIEDFVAEYLPQQTVQTILLLLTMMAKQLPRHDDV